MGGLSGARGAQVTKPHHKRAFSLVELLVVIAIIAVLLSLSLVALRSVRASVENTRCLNNLRQLMQGVNMLKNSDDGLLPFASYSPIEPDGPSKSWQELHAEWSEAMGVPSPKVRDGVRDNRTWKVFDTSAPWRCPLDKPGAIQRQYFPA